MNDLRADLQTALDALGWHMLPVWARVVSVAYGIGLIALGNLSVLRNLWRAGALAARGVGRAVRGLAAWWTRPGATAALRQEVAELAGQIRLLTGQVPPHTLPAPGVPFTSVPQRRS